MELMSVLLLANMLILLILLRIIWRITRLFRKGEDMNKVTKSLVITLGGLLGAQVSRSALKKLLK